MATVLLLLAGFVALYYGAEWLVAGAGEIASHLKISRSVIGLTLVAFGTSAPEFFVNVIAAAGGHTDIAMSNVAGSNLTNLCIGFGLTSMVVIVPLTREKFLTDLIFFMITPIIVVACLWLSPAPRALPVWALIPFVIALAWYLVSLFRRRKAENLDLPTMHDKIIIPLGTFVVGACALYLGGELVFENSVDLATAMEVSESVIGLTIVAFGTSIPDVTASVVAARRGELDIAAGNLIGSNISNILVVLGATLIAAGKSLAVEDAIVTDYGLVCLLTTIFAGTMIFYQRLTRLMGLLLLATFCIYVGIRVTVALTHS